MAPRQYFVAPFKPLPRDNSVKSSAFELQRKRKWEHTDSSVRDDGQTISHDLSLPDGIQPGLSATLSRSPGQIGLVEDTGRQCSISGKSSSEEYSRGILPHAYQPSIDINPGESTDEPYLGPYVRLDATAPAKRVLDDRNDHQGLRRRHVAAISAIVHRCILEGDYGRASRAFGMLLRAEINGQSIDLRFHDQWGLGAEILLHSHIRIGKDSDQLKENSIVNADLAEDGGEHRATTMPDNDLAFEQAKDYYERLVLQYPHQKANPDSTGPPEFYIALFGLWISFVQGQHGSALDGIEAAVATGKDLESALIDETGNTSITTPDLYRHQSRELVREETLQRARAIEARLNELLISPPYSDIEPYRELQRMIRSWIDILRQPLKSRANRPNARYESASATSDVSDEPA